MSVFFAISILLLSSFINGINGCGRPCSVQLCEEKDDDHPCAVPNTNIFDVCGCDDSICPQSTCGNCDVRGENESKYAHCLRMCYEYKLSENNGCADENGQCEAYCDDPTNFNELDDGFACIVDCPGSGDPCISYPDGYELNENGECKCPKQVGDECEEHEECCEAYCVELPIGEGKKQCWLD